MDVLKSFLDRLASFDLWAIATIIYAVGVKVCGNNFWPVLFLTFLMIAFDTLTRWDCICKKYIMDHNPEETDITLKATPKEGCAFAGWEKGGQYCLQ